MLQVDIGSVGSLRSVFRGFLLTVTEISGKGFNIDFVFPFLRFCTRVYHNKKYILDKIITTVVRILIQSLSRYDTDKRKVCLSKPRVSRYHGTSYNPR